MAKSLTERLSAEAPASLQAAVFGLLISSPVALVIFGFLLWLLPDSATGLAPYLGLGAGLAFYVGYVAWATPRVRVLRIYGESLAAAMDEPIGTAGGRVWSAQGPGLRILGLAMLLPLLALLLPASLLLIATISTTWDLSGVDSISPIGWVLVGVSIMLIAAIGWLTYRVVKPNETTRLLNQACRDPEQAQKLVERAVALTPRVYPRSTASWIGGAAFYAWGGSYAFNQITSPFSLDRTLELALWVLISTAVAIFAVRSARRAGAPVAVWTGIVLWILFGTALSTLVYAGTWDAFGSMITETGGSLWSAPSEYIRYTGIRLLANVPLLVAAWVVAVKTEPAPAPLA